MKNKRLDIVLEIIKDEICLTQDDLQEKLVARGYNVTQSTVSRDIKQLNIIKALDTNGNYRYMAPQKNFSSGNSHTGEQYSDLFAHSAVAVDNALNNVVVKCYPGMASTACVSIDKLFSDKILGSLAGDDTIIIITKTPEIATALAEQLRKLCKG